MNVKSIPTVAAVRPRSAPAAPAVHAPLTPVKASTPVRLPSFASLDAYKSHVSDLAAAVQAMRRNLEKAPQADVGAMKKRLDAAMGQLVLLRDQYPIPSSWTRPKWLLGEGFDKAQFWRDLVETLPDGRFDAERFQGKLIDAARAQEAVRDPWARDQAVTEDLKGALSLAGSAADVATVIRQAKRLFYYHDSLDKLNFAAADRGVAVTRTLDEAIALAEVVKECSVQPSHSDRNIAVLLRRGGELATGVPDVLRLMEALDKGFREDHRIDAPLVDLARRGLTLARTAEEYIAVARATDEFGWSGSKSDAVVKSALEKAISTARTPAQCKDVIEVVRRALPYPLDIRDELIRKAMARSGSL